MTKTYYFTNMSYCFNTIKYISNLLQTAEQQMYICQQLSLSKLFTLRKRDLLITKYKTMC